MFRIAAAAILAAGMAGAEPVPIDQVTGEISGREVLVAGKFGKRGGIGASEYILLTEDGAPFTVELALDRKGLAAVRDCSLEGFSQSNACNVTMKAEIAVRGAKIDLIAFEIVKD